MNSLLIQCVVSTEQHIKLKLFINMILCSANNDVIRRDTEQLIVAFPWIYVP
jgi:hypothetical protein